jgi:hypothetical protein
MVTVCFACSLVYQLFEYVQYDFNFCQANFFVCDQMYMLNNIYTASIRRHTYAICYPHDLTTTTQCNVFLQDARK